MKKILFISGDPSGADYINQIAEVLIQHKQRVRVVAVGDELNRVAGVEYLMSYRVFAHIGFVAVVLHLFSIVWAIRKILRWCRKNQPDFVVLVDAPGLNLHLLPKLRPWCSRIVYFISPQFWAWGYERINGLRGKIDKVYPVFPFEIDMYREAQIPAQLVEHPKYTRIIRHRALTAPQERSPNVDQNRRVIGLLPGSRRSEIKRFLPILKKTAQILIEKHQRLNFILPVRSDALSRYQRYLLKKQFGDRLTVIEDDFLNAVQRCDYCLCASGTACLEVALMNVPLVVYYRLGWLDTLLIRRRLTTRFISLINLLLDRRVVSECVAELAHPKVLSAELETLMADRAACREQIENFARLRAMLTCDITIANQISELLFDSPAQQKQRASQVDEQSDSESAG